MKIRQRGEGILTANVSGRLMGVVVRWDLGIFGGGREDRGRGRIKIMGKMYFGYPNKIVTFM